MRRKVLLSFFAFLVVISLQILLYTNETIARTPKGEFRIAVDTMSDEPMEPVQGTVCSKWYYNLMYDSLVGIEPPSMELSHKTGVAKRWEHSADYKDWTFYLREGIKFHNGEDLTAEDVKYTLDRAVGPVSISTNKGIVKDTIDSVEVIDRYKVVVHCKNPSSMLPIILSENIGAEAMIVPKDYIEEKGNDYFRLHPIGSGPYKFKEHKVGAYLLCEAVDKHWAFGVPKYKYIRFSIVPEYIARLGLLERGETDLITVPRRHVPETKKRGFPILKDPQNLNTIFFIANTFKKECPQSDIRVREALNIAIDRKAVHDKLYSGLGELARYQWAIPASIGYEPAPLPYPYNPERAKELLKEAGYGPDKPCKMNLYSFPMTGHEEAEDFVKLAAAWWDDVGFDITIKKLPEFAPYRKMVLSGKTGCDIWPDTFGGRVWSVPTEYIIKHSSGGPFSTAKMPDMDRAMEEAMAAVDPDKQATLAHRVHMMCYNRYLDIPLVTVPGCYSINTKTVPNWKDWKMGATVYDINLEWVLFN